jgi:3-hydroxyacyl-[acyl-carrier protein] dehydratase/trans-2-decenoyl-[acyl-carrier protein] isomerase
MFHRITNVQVDKGKYNRGLIEAEFDIEKKLWFFDCHFKEDPVMPGCLGLDAMWQLVGFYLGWKGEPGKGRALGVNSVKFTGEVLTSVKIARYEVSMKRILKKEGAVVGLADAILYADNKAIYQAESLKVGLFK